MCIIYTDAASHILYKKEKEIREHKSSESIGLSIPLVFSAFT